MNKSEKIIMWITLSIGVSIAIYLGSFFIYNSTSDYFRYITLGEYNIVVDEFIFPKLYSEKELVEAMNKSFNAEFRVVDDYKESYDSHTYIMVPDFDESLEITVKTKSGLDYSDGGRIMGASPYAQNNYNTLILDMNCDKAVRLADEYGFELTRNEPQSYAISIKSYSELEKAREFYFELNKLLSFHEYDSIPDPSGESNFFAGPHSTYLTLIADVDIYGEDPRGFGFFSLIYFHSGIVDCEGNKLATIQSEYIGYFEERGLKDDTIPNNDD